MNRQSLCGLGLALLMIAAPAIATEPSDKPESREQAAWVSMPKTSLTDILDSVSKKSGKKFLVAHRVDPEIVIAQLKPKDIDYSSLLLVLRNNNLATATIGNIVNIVPVHVIRQYPLPVINDDDDTIDGEEWVTRVIHLKNANARELVPIMRPIMPPAGHLAANPDSNTIMIVDRYANVRRITEMLRKMDASTPHQATD